MPLPAHFHSTEEEVLQAYPQDLVTVTCEGISGGFLGGHWAVRPISAADYFVKCFCGCGGLYTVSHFESHAGRGASKKWRESLKVEQGGNKQSLGTWIDERSKADDAGLPRVHSRVAVYWPGAAGTKWHHGTVRDIDANGCSLVAYDDGDRERLHFAMERFKFEEGTPPPGVKNILELLLKAFGNIWSHNPAGLSAVPLRGMRKRASVQGSTDDSAIDSSTDEEDNYTQRPRQSRSPHTRQTRPHRRCRINNGRSRAQDVTSASSHQTSGPADQGSADRGASAGRQPLVTAAIQDQIPEDNQEMDQHGSATSYETASSQEAAPAPTELASLVPLPPPGPQPAARLPSPLYLLSHPSSGTPVHVTAPAAAQQGAGNATAAAAAASQLHMAAGTSVGLAPTGATALPAQPAPPVPPATTPLPPATLATASARAPPAAAAVLLGAQPHASGKRLAEAHEPSDASVSAAAMPSASPVTLQTAVADVNQRLLGMSDMNIITAQQLEGLEGSLDGIEELLMLGKGDIKHVLMDESFGGRLSLKQALFLQTHIMRLKQH